MQFTPAQITALVLGTMLGSRMLFSLLKPQAHRSLAINLYNKKHLTTKRIFYSLVSLWCSYLIIRDTSIVYFILAMFAIGAIWDIYNTFFKYPKVSEIKKLLKTGKPIPFYLSSKPSRNTLQSLIILGLVIWLYIYIF